MTLGVVVPCLGQERFLPRTLAALEGALAGREWRGALVLSAPDGAPPATGAAWRVLRARGPRPLTPGAARNRGLAACGGEGVLCVDADVELERAWLERALAALAADPALAGAGGRLDAWYTDGPDGRAGERDLNRSGDVDADVPYLAAAALYRRAALERVGGFAEGLGSEEDFELGLRLARAGFRLRHLGALAGRHWSAPRPSRGELARRWRAGLCFGPGQALRLLVGRPGFAAVARRNAHYAATLALWLAAPLALALGGPRALAAWALAPLALLALMSARKRSPRRALHSLLTWSVFAAGMVVGFVRGPLPGGGEVAAC